jgi:RND family efflux transporter MFP subunit
MGVIFAAGALGAWWALHAREGGHRSGADEARPGRAEPAAASGALRVAVVHPEKGGITRTSTQPGSVHWFQWAELYAKVSGYLEDQSVDIGSHVKDGQLLAVIDNPEVLKEAERDAAAVTQARAAVTQAEARVRTTQADLESARAMVKKAEADIERYTAARTYRQKVLDRFKGLLKQQAVDQQVVDEQEEAFDAAVAAEHSAEAEVFSTKAKVTSAQAMVEQARADLGEAKANVDVAEATLAKAKVFVDYTRIVSPYDGVITFRGFHPGDFIRSADVGGVGKPILTVARTDKVRVVTYIPDRDVPYTNVGDKATLTVDALPGEPFTGTVTRFAETEDPQSRTMRTEVDMPNPEDRLREGMYGNLSIVLHHSEKTLTIPTACLTGQTGQGSSSVFVLRDGRVHLTPVKTGVDNGLRIEIHSGLDPDDDVVTQPGQVDEGVAAEPLAPADRKPG